MDTTRSIKPPKSYISSWSRASTRLGLRIRPPPPLVSAPFGPVKSSRGPDLNRSDTFIIVDGIKQCSDIQTTGILNSAYSNLPPDDADIARAGKLTQSLSAGFPKSPLAGTPTVAESNITVTTSLQCPPNTNLTPRVRFRQASLSASPRPHLKSTLKTSSTVSLLPCLSPIYQDENTPPHLEGGKGYLSKHKNASNSKLTKSRTMNVLHELKTSISRSSLKATAASNSFDKERSFSSSNTAIPKSSSKLRLPQFSQTSLVAQTCHFKSYTPEPDPHQISEAQPSAYWSGRFVSLYDKLSSENLSPEPLYSLASAYRQGNHNSLSISSHYTGTPKMKPSYLSHATTTSALTSLMHKPQTPPSLHDEDSQSCRIFQRLESHCCTQEAKDSLHDWQQDYARRHNKPSLLPKGGTMEGKGSLMSKWFSSQGRSGGRRSLSALREATSSRSTKKVSIEDKSSRSIRGSISKPIGPLVRVGGLEMGTF